MARTNGSRRIAPSGGGGSSDDSDPEYTDLIGDDSGGGGGGSSSSGGGGSTGVRDTASRVDDQTSSNQSSDPFDSGSTGSEVIGSGGDTSRARGTGSSSGSNDATATPSRGGSRGGSSGGGSSRRGSSDRQSSGGRGSSRGSGGSDPNPARRGADPRPAPQEEFGDFDYSFGLGGPGDEVERAVADASRGYSETIDRAVESRTGTRQMLLGVDLATDAARTGGDIFGFESEANAAADLGEEVAEGAVKEGLELGNVPGAARSVAEAVEFGATQPQRLVEVNENAAENPFGPRDEAIVTFDDEGAADFGADLAERGAQVADAAKDSAQENPGEFAGRVLGGLAGGAGGSVAAGRAAGRAGRFATDRVRTAGGTEVELEDVTSDSVAESYTGGTPDSPNFPGADDADLYETDPAEAVRRQADRDTPDEVDEFFESAGVEDGEVLKKAVDTEPDGPGSGGFATQEGSYESPGGFVGPSLSPNFLRAGTRTETSLRPGLPRTGRPTGVLVKTDVENTGASDLDEFNAELRDLEGDTTARTKPADDVNTGEIEAVIPSNAEFEGVGNQGLLREFGVGSDFYTTVAGRRVPLRTVAPSDSGGGTGLDADDLQLDVDADEFGGGGRSLDEYLSPDDSVDRPVPAVGGGESFTLDSGSSSGSGGPAGSSLSVDSFGVTDTSSSGGGGSSFTLSVDSFGVSDTTPSGGGSGGSGGGPGFSPPGGGGGSGGSGSPGGNPPSGGGGGSPDPSGGSGSGFFRGISTPPGSSKPPEFGFDDTDIEDEFFESNIEETAASFESGIADPEDLL